MLQKLLALDELGDNCYRSTAHQKNFRNTLFGGQAVAQSLMAAGLTANQRPPHSLHAYFLRPGKADVPIYYQVEVLRDGRSVSTRNVRATQEDKLIFSMQASFHNPEQGFEHSTKPPTNRRNPDEIKKSFSEETVQYLKNNADLLSLTTLDFVPFNDDLISDAQSTQQNLQFWMRSSQSLDDDPLSHYCALAFASDIGLLGTSLLTHNCQLFGGKVLPASMDHSMWFHSQPNFNDWQRYVTKSPWAGGARALCSGEFFDYNDKLVATAMQEGIVRPIRAEL